MKALKTVLVIMVIMSICIVANASLWTTVGANDIMSHVYPLSGIVVAVIPENDIIVIQDYNGNMWEWSGIEDWYEGDIAAMIMYDNYTESIYDDEIIDIMYSGWIQ